jgi:hypothetical protein
MALSASTSEYQFTSQQSNMLSAPIVGQYFAEQDMVYTTDNASTKAHFGLSSHDQQSYDAANYYLFNPAMELGVDCGRTNESAARPNLSSVQSAGGGACFPMSMSAQRASKQLDASYNSYAPSAEQVVLAEGDIRYAPSRFVDQNNYITPPVSDLSFQPRLMGTRDTVASGCYNTNIDQTVGNSTACAIMDDPLPYFRSSDPRTSYGVDEPHSAYWSSLDEGDLMPNGCQQMDGDYMLDTSLCNLNSVEAGMPPRIPPQYGDIVSPSAASTPQQQAHQKMASAMPHAAHHSSKMHQGVKHDAMHMHQSNNHHHASHMHNSHHANHGINSHPHKKSKSPPMRGNVQRQQHQPGYVDLNRQVNRS